RKPLCPTAWAVSFSNRHSAIHLQENVPMMWTLENLKARSPAERHRIYMNACAKAHTPEGAQLKQLLEQSGLPYSDDAALKNDDPITIKMTEIIFSPEGRQAALAATAAGEAAMAGIDPLLQQALGVDYGAHNMGTNTAGSIVAVLMRQLGFEAAGKKALPAGCVAKTAETWRRRGGGGA
ncbi:MAG: hypothetical protein ABL932_17820, partial [Terricaulis sp.]